VAHSRLYGAEVDNADDVEAADENGNYLIEVMLFALNDIVDDEFRPYDQAKDPNRFRYLRGKM